MTFSFGITLLFLLYLVFWIQMPGMLWESILMPRRLKLATRLLSAFFLGFIYLAALYFIESFLSFKGIISVAGPLTSLVAIFVYIKKGRPSLFNAGEHPQYIGVIIFGFIFIASVLNFQLRYIGAFSGQTIQVYHDYLFHTGNIVSLSRSFPNMDIRVDGLMFYYHYFYELIFAMCKHIFGMDAFRLYINGNALVTAFPLTLSLIIIGERLRAGRITHKINFFFYCAGTLVSCICLLPLNVVGGRLPFSWLDNHLFGNGNALGMAMSLSILMIDVLTEVWYERTDVKLIIALYLLSAVTTGFKGTTGILIVAIAWSVLIIESIITRRFNFGRLLYVISISLGFALTYLIVTVGLNSSGSNNRAMVLTPQGTLEASRIGQLFTKLGLDYMEFPWVVIGVVLCAICIVGPCIFAFCAFAYERFKRLIKEGIIGDIFDWFVIGQVIMGVAGFCAISVPGLSQGYFVITNAGFIFYGAMRYIIDNRKSLIAHVTYLFFGIGTAFLALDMVYFGYSDIQQAAIFNQVAGDRADLVSKQTLDAYLWLRDNTDEDALVAVDRFSEELDYRSIYFYCSAFSERQCYLEGYDYSDVTDRQIEAMLSINERFYSESALEAETAMDMAGIDYLVVTKMAHPDYQSNSLKLKLVYTNDEVEIYRFDSEGGLSAVN